MKTQDIYAQVLRLLDKNADDGYESAIDDCLCILRDHGFDEPKFTHMWSHDDIQEALVDGGYKRLKKAQLEQVVDLILKSHDAEIGISNETIIVACQTLKFLKE